MVTDAPEFSENTSVLEYGSNKGVEMHEQHSGRHSRSLHSCMAESQSGTALQGSRWSGPGDIIGGTSWDSVIAWTAGIDVHVGPLLVFTVFAKASRFVAINTSPLASQSESILRIAFKRWVATGFDYFVFWTVRLEFSEKATLCIPTYLYIQYNTSSRLRCWVGVHGTGLTASTGCKPNN